MGTSEAVLEHLAIDSPRRRPAGLLPIATAALVWELLGRAGWLGAAPPASATVVQLFTILGRDGVGAALLTSLINLIAGVAAASVCGIAVGLAFWRSPFFTRMFGVYFDALMAVPTVVYVPVMFGLFGTSRVTQLAVIFAFAFFTVAATTEVALARVNAGLIGMARAFGASERQVFWTVLLPGAAPTIITGLRSGAVRAVKGMLIGEMLVAFTGLGAMLKAYGARFDVASTLAVVLLVTLIGLAVNATVARLGGQLLRRFSLRPTGLRTPATDTALETAARNR